MHRLLILCIISFCNLIYASVYLNTARIAYSNEQDYMRARNACLEGIAEGEIDFELYVILSGCEIAFNNWHAAADALTQAFATDSVKTAKWIKEKGAGEKYFHQAYYFSARDYFMNGKYEEALDQIRHATVFKQDDTNVRILKGATFYMLDRIEDANKEYSIVLARDPQNPDIHFLIGKSLFEVEQFDSSLTYFLNAVMYYEPKYTRVLDIVVQRLPETDSSLLQEVLVLWSIKKFHTLDELIRTKLGFTDGLAAHSEIFERFSKTATNLARNYYYLGMTYHHLERDSLALGNLQRCLYFKPDDTDALFFAAEILVKFKQYERAVEYLENATQLYQEDIYAWFYLGVSYTQLRKYQKAINVYEKNVLRLNPKHVDALTNLAFIYSELGNYAKSNEYLQKVEQIIQEDNK